ncbi:MAG: hypothetical protein R2758_09750 [Bacteroidales bacterium]
MKQNTEGLWSKYGSDGCHHTDGSVINATDYRSQGRTVENPASPMSLRELRLIAIGEQENENQGE